MTRSAGSIRFRGVRRLFDPLLALALLTAGLVEVWKPLDTSLGQGSRPLATVVCVLATVALAFRRRWPLVAALCVCAPAVAICAVTPIPLLFFGGLLPLLIATYTLAAKHFTRWLLLPVAGMVALQIEIPAFHRPGEIVFDWLFIPAAAAVGLVVAAREAKVSETESRTAALERVAVTEERARIARELHDVVAHALSVVVVQAGAAIDDEPARAREALRSIRATGIEALAEMRRMLGILRESGDELALAPQPTVAELDPLLDHTRAAGVAAALEVEGSPRPLPPGVDLAAYRIVQEALTNVRKHSNAATVRVRLRYDPDAVEIEIEDDGAGAGAGANGGGGHGLIGMRRTRRPLRRPPERRSDQRTRLPGTRKAADGMIRVLLADDQALVRGGFRLILDRDPEIEVVGEAIDGNDAIARSQALRPDLVLMDVRMPGVDGIEATRRLVRDPHFEGKVLMLTTFDLDEYLVEALRAGASGFLLKDVDPPDLVHAVHAVIRGDALLAPTITRRLLERHLARVPIDPPTDFTEREMEVVRLVARGLSNSEIGRELFLGEATVKTYITRVLGKLSLRDRVQIVVWAYESGFVVPAR